MICEHKWIFQVSEYEFIRGDYASLYSRFDSYFCEKCLVIKEIQAKQESSRMKPYWYHGQAY